MEWASELLKVGARSAAAAEAALKGGVDVLASVADRQEVGVQGGRPKCPRPL